jgi:hypothetical protein
MKIVENRTPGQSSLYQIWCPPIQTETIDETFGRFPHLFQNIFNNLDNNSLINCREVCQTWKSLLDFEKFVCLRRIQKYQGRLEPLDQWIKVIKKTPVEDIIVLCQVVENLFKLGKNKMTYNYSPLQIAAETGSIQLCRGLIETDHRNNDSYLPNLTPLHLAAENGHFEVFRLILENATTKNPVAFNGLTPLHSAAKGGYTKIIKLLIANGVDKKPLFNEQTPLQLAALNGHVYACLILYKDWEDVIHFWEATNARLPVIAPI